MNALEIYCPWIMNGHSFGSGSGHDFTIGQANIDALYLSFCITGRYT